MDSQTVKKGKKRISIGLLAHVDAGKTTLSEALLYISGHIRRMGRVDHKDAFLDTYELERERGITIFSKQAVLQQGETVITLLDTPGHVDFSAETERTLQVLDAAVLVINGSDGVQGHTETLWRLLKRYHVPVFIFVNKMDQPGTDREMLLSELEEKLDSGCVDFSHQDTEGFFESIAMCDEKLLNDFLQKGRLETEGVQRAIWERKVFPCFFGSALKLWGVQELLEGVGRYAGNPAYLAEFGAKIYKITRDGQGNRLTHMKITGGKLCARALLSDVEGKWQEKVNQIRIYSGEKFETVSEAEAGCICAVTGLTKTRPGEGLGAEKLSAPPVLQPVLCYRIELPEGCEAALVLAKIRELEEEEPMLHITWEETLQEIHAQVMGEIQIEVLKSLIQERFGLQVNFGKGKIVYKETIAERTEGVGHFEPLRHYAEVHLLLEPGEAGSGLVFDTRVSEDLLARNWQRLILSHLEEKEHKGVLIGAPITDMKITLVAGKAHLKHTEGGDFRQATYRALRQGLMEARSVLLEPVYEYRLEIPEECIGRAMTDIEKRKGSFSLEQRTGQPAVLTGTVPAAAMQEYQKEVTAYTRGLGRLSCTLKGYAPCHNTDEVIEEAGYEPERDMENPADSVFCAHGAGFVVPYYQVKDYMHLESVFSGEQEETRQIIPEGARRAAEERAARETREISIGTEEIDAIINRTAHANSRVKGSRGENGRSREGLTRVYKGQEKRKEYLLVDGYNVIFAWEELKELAAVNLDSARGRLLDILCDYQGMKQCHLIAVFDAYRVQGHPEEAVEYHNIHVVYTKEAETADRYIEKFAHENSKKYDVTVATSDGLEQIIIRGEGCRLLSARDLKEEIRLAKELLLENYQDSHRAEKQEAGKRYLLDEVSEEVSRHLENIKGKV